MPYYAHLKYVAIELTNACNLKCKICWSQNPKLRPPRPKGFMTKELFTKVINELAQDPENHSIALHYAGESTLHPMFKEFSYQAKNSGIAEVTLATNGLLLNPENRKTILECYHKVAVSLHNQPDLGASIRNMIQLEKENLAAGKKCGVRVNITQDEFTMEQLQEIYGRLMFEVEFVREFREITEDMKLKFRRGPMSGFCPSKYWYLAVLWNGDTLPCCHMLSSGDWSLGNVVEKSLHDVFYGYKYKRLRQGHEKNTPCLNCEVRK